VTARGGHHVALVHDVQSGLAGSLGLSGGLDGLFRANERLSLDQTHEVLTLSEAMAGAIRELKVRPPVGVLPLWATVPRPSDATLAQGSRTVQLSGAFGGKHGVEMILELARLMETDAEGVGLVLRGAGETFRLLGEDIRAAGLRNVVFEDLVPEDELASALASSPIHVVSQAPGTGSFVMPSKLINALTCGAFVLAICEPSSALAQLAASTPGLEAFAPGEIHLLVKRVGELLDRPSLLDERRAIATSAAERYSRDRILRELEARFPST
jgi:colanic acid biosynthesis glycosyl transferase WcaI